jgi:hypothetical protein
LSEDDISGTDWTADEVNACVDAYFFLFTAQLDGKTVIKAQIYRDLMENVNRSVKSIEWKFQNISAVLDEMGLDWVSGLRPARNFQKLLADSISLRLPTFLAKASPISVHSFEEAQSLYVGAAPERGSVTHSVPEYVRNLVRKFDPVERDRNNRKLGKAGEKLAFEYEVNSLNAADRRDLARKVKWVSEEDGDGAGYDILSFNPNGSPRYVEVKTTVGNERTPFFISRNELEFAKAEKEHFRLFRIYDFRKQPRAFELPGELDRFARITPQDFRADFLA